MTRRSKPDGDCCWPAGAGEGDCCWAADAGEGECCAPAGAVGDGCCGSRMLPWTVSNTGAVLSAVSWTVLPRFLNHLRLLRGLPRRQRGEDGREWQQRRHRRE